MLRPDTLALTALLALLGGLMPLTVDILLPALPDVARSLGTSNASVQLTISAYFIGGAVGTIAYGPISDRIGRRPALLSALVIYCAGSVICALAPTVEVLVGGRVLQALGPSGCAVISRAIVRDIYEGARIGRQLSLMSMMMGFFPVCAPPIGGLIQVVFGWRGIFALMLIIGGVALTVSALTLQETLRTRSTSVSLGAVTRVYASLLGNRTYRAYVAILSTAYLGLIAWIFGAPFVLQEIHGLTPQVFSIVFITATSGYLIGAGIASRYVLRLGFDRVIGIGATVTAAAGLLMVVLAWLDVAPVISLMLTMACYMIGIGGVFPQSIAGSLAPFRDRAGAAASFAGFLQQALGALAGMLIGRMLGGSAVALGGTIAACGCLTLVLWYATRRIRAEGLPAPEGV